MQAIDDFGSIREELRRFAKERDWEKFHTPKNLLMALTGELGELVSLFQWLTPTETSQLMLDPVEAEKVRDELADVLIYAIRLADVLDVDPKAAVRSKMAKNAVRYSVERSRGHARKAPQQTVKN
ncbi:MAG: nucleotide pyrophosphohydrolase [Chloroflexi bacterium]|nr:nucleotide pyrophosphohydrolase [Chloroflexota bacterium]